MNNKMCPTCKELNVEFGIRSPEELAKAIRIAQANVADGTIQPVDSPKEFGLANTAPIESIKADGPWNNHMLYLFRCAKCGARFKLFAETDYSSGGV